MKNWLKKWNRNPFLDINPLEKSDLFCNRKEQIARLSCYKQLNQNFNLIIIGPKGSGKRSLVNQVFERGIKVIKLHSNLLKIEPNSTKHIVLFDEINDIKSKDDSYLRDLGFNDAIRLPLLEERELHQIIKKRCGKNVPFNNEVWSLIFSIACGNIRDILSMGSALLIESHIKRTDFSIEECARLFLKKGYFSDHINALRNSPKEAADILSYCRNKVVTIKDSAGLKMSENSLKARLKLLYEAYYIEKKIIGKGKSSLTEYIITKKGENLLKISKYIK